MPEVEPPGSVNTVRDTEHGALDIAAEMTEAWRIGFAPDPFAWTPWNYASEAGRFDGRWDDPDGRFRTLYLGDSFLGVLLEVLARLRADLPLLDELAAIEDNDDCDRDYPTQIGGTVPREWVHRRMSGSVRLRGEFVDVRRARTVATCRARFGAFALTLGLPDLDSGALAVDTRWRNGETRQKAAQPCFRAQRVGGTGRHRLGRKR